MTKAIECLVRHYESLPRRSLDVPELSEIGGVVCWSSWTLAERAELSRYVNEDDVAIFARVLVLKAENKKGERLFGREDIPRLRASCHDKVLRRIGVAILADNEESNHG
ncbi:hypothetical protein [Methyloceanibacter sp.]|uniref:hypothetical protein n=1 Tax=Methyloceanibacter sp. TaxID=1965321 RepID=UPI002BAF2D8D|nr:hypothetical protein [Methyloceanibacter sp.]HML93246.1 hypothetical protein [Methyloceanibacter sp.]